MIKEFALNPYEGLNWQYRQNIKRTVEYLKGKLRGGWVLDVGQRSPLTDAIEKEFGVVIHNTLGDLDTDFPVSRAFYYDEIIYSHTIEHQFNPLFTLLNLRKLMDHDTQLFIMVPSRPKFLWTKGHFHEIDHYRMTKLIERAGMRIVGYERKKEWRKWWTYLLGIRAFLRLFFEFNAYYIIKLI